MTDSELLNSLSRIDTNINAISSDLANIRTTITLHQKDIEITNIKLAEQKKDLDNINSILSQQQGAFKLSKFIIWAMGIIAAMSVGVGAIYTLLKK